MQPATLQAATGCTPANAERYAAPLTGAMDEFGILRPAQQAAFLAQITHESARLSRVQENLNYSWQRLRQVWPRRFPSDEFAKQYHQQPAKVASYVYAGRLGNGLPSTGDGFRFAGKGLIQITGRDNYTACGKALGLPLLVRPELLLEPAPAARSAAWFWKSINGNKYVADDDIEGLSRAINGGTNGLAERLALTKRAMQVLA